MKHWLQGLTDFWQRYRQAFVHSWAMRAELAPVPRTREELAFMPAHLALTDTPVSPLPRWSMRLIVALFGIALLWAWFGQLDIVAVADGKTVSGGRTKTIQPLETAVVRSIHVRDGQYVRAGQTLLTLGGSDSDSDVRKTRDSLQAANLAAARYRSLLAAQASGTAPQLGAVAGADASALQAEQALASGQWQAYLSKRDALAATLRQREAELATTQQLIAKLQATSQLADAREQDFKNLLEQNFISKHAWLEKQQAKLEQRSDLAAQQSRAVEIQAAIQNQRQELAALSASFRSDALDQLRQAEDQARQYQQDSSRSQQRQAWMTLTAPVAGTVQQLTVHTVGGVVTEAQPLLAIVPDKETLEVEAMVQNKDIGFVRVGQPVTVKVESFPYTRYGYLEGKVESISHDALQDEKRGLVYQARVRLPKTWLLVDGTRVNLTAGMVVSAEIKTGKRQVMDYFLSPLKANLAESNRER
ncbi:HlyD family type I secretion periplasmic adaptor subunit [Vogesella sp. DC21W]|uniref:Membrane fusion protein (MFP) family protein n=1 Tax=Vogesella aquatica TaxID=2984206 RepID=A0ABT5IWH7_9NEIS|nr:HlyD family type I secretion periplasmic adaptor subunit [Vogesella aquatica]MDC7716538.1 HlyD family type I secretion periplasmic adaptor subunit [Vogesella aquatica]